MKNKYLLLVCCTLSMLFICSCTKERGCTDNNARNHSFLAEEDDGSCVYSTATFYASNGYYAGIPIMKIEVTVDGSAIGSITSVYPAGPGNCSAQGTLAYTFEGGRKVDWNATVYLANGGIIFGSGQAAPLSSQDCIKINVTR